MTAPIDSFADLGLAPPILQALQDVGYENPSPIQAACIPVLLERHDLLGMAQTGTGKTAAFALPVLAQINLQKKQPQALVLTPTRELAIQVAEAFQKYARHLPGFHVLPIYGGQSLGIQLRQLDRGAHVVVGTPGRVMDHLERKSLNLDGLQTLVLDEADEMLRMGFIDDVEWILQHTPATRQTALFSATMPEQIRRVAQKYLREPQEVKIKSATSTVAAIRQRYWQVSGLHKLDALTRILEVEEDFDAAIIFVRTKTATVELAEKLEARGYAAAALNGDMTQPLRERVIDQLKGGGLDIVIATDVAARGIDVPRVSHVINYDIPYDTEAYVHRIGRTGRAGRQGAAILFVAPREMRMLRTIEKVTRQPIEPLVLPSKEAVANRRVARFKELVTETMAAEGLEFFADVVAQIEEDGNVGIHEIAAALACLAQKESPLQLEEKDFPAARREWTERPPRSEGGERPRGEWTERPRSESRERPSFAERGREERGERFERKPRYDAEGESAAPRREERAPRSDFADEAPRRERPAAPEGEMTRYKLGVGRNQGATPKDIVGAIANEAGIQSRFIGRIDLFDDFSTVELPAGMPKEVENVLKRVRVRGFPLDLQADDGTLPPARQRPAAGRDFDSGARRQERPPFRSDERPAFRKDDRAGGPGGRPAFRKEGGFPGGDSRPRRPAPGGKKPR